jgi:predicted small lipoprotein YifL
MNKFFVAIFILCLSIGCGYKGPIPQNNYNFEKSDESF